jgi:O-antigen/teichoic acid export membrane protein
MKIDQVMLGNMTNSQEVGNYAAAVRFSEVFYFIPIIVCSSVFPAIIRAKQADPIVYNNRLQQLYDMMGWFSLMIALPMTVIGIPLLQFLLGSEYSESGRILTWHIWASPFVFLGVARSQWLTAENYTRFSFLTTSLGTIVNIGLNFWLIPIYGGQGAAIATVISYAVSSHLSCCLYPPMYSTGWMLTKALFIPFRLRQNMSYLNFLKMVINKSA